MTGKVIYMDSYDQTDLYVPPENETREGFLPIKTNTFDRVFISVVCFVAISLLWMRFVEAYLHLSIAVIISLVLAVVIIRRG